jgi:hypothetical protein
MKWYKNLYVSEEAESEKKNIIKSIKKNKLVFFGYVIIIEAKNNSGSDGLLTILHSAFFLKNYAKRDEVLIVGIAYSRRDALELAGNIVYEVYQKTGGFDIREYII